MCWHWQAKRYRVVACTDIIQVIYIVVSSCYVFSALVKTELWQIRPSRTGWSALMSMFLPLNWWRRRGDRGRTWWGSLHPQSSPNVGIDHDLNIQLEHELDDLQEAQRLADKSGIMLHDLFTNDIKKLQRAKHLTQSLFLPVKPSFPELHPTKDDPLTYLEACEEFLVVHRLDIHELLTLLHTVLQRSPKNWWIAERNHITTWQEFKTRVYSGFHAELEERVSPGAPKEHVQFRVQLSHSLFDVNTWRDWGRASAEDFRSCQRSSDRYYTGSCQHSCWFCRKSHRKGSG